VCPVERRSPSINRLRARGGGCRTPANAQHGRYIILMYCNKTLMRHFSKRLHSYINHLLNAPSRPGRALLTCNFLSSSISAAIKNHARPSRRISDWSLLTPKARGIAARSKIPSLLPHAFAHLLRGQDRKLSVEASHASEPIYTIFHKQEPSARDRSDFTSPQFFPNKLSGVTVPHPSLFRQFLTSGKGPRATAATSTSFSTSSHPSYISH
jgi:hypothetical protein